MTIAVTFEPADLVALPNKTFQYADVEAALYNIRALAQHRTDLHMFGLVEGDEPAFNTWQAANPEKATIISDVPGLFSEGWQVNWNFLEILHPDIEWRQAPGMVAGNDPLAMYQDILGKAKNARYKKIDEKTRELIAVGFEYPTTSGQMFSLSSEAQIKWIGLYVAKDIVSYPVVIVTTDEQDNVSINDTTEMTAFYTAMVTAVRGHIDSGRALKNTLRDASTSTEDDVISTATDGR